MLPKFHAAAGAVALLTIAGFWTATVTTLLIGDKYLIAMVKLTIAWGLLGVIPMLLLAGLSGNRLARAMRGPVIAAKQRRMKIIAINGVVFLVPSALTLLPLAMQGQGGLVYYGIQLIELAAGATNITLLALNMRDGMRLARRRAMVA
ncbi:hypothetical protein [Celeribacter neptunius]|uniref:Transmembrane protein n=1 Tax=Celeribacter neptunius TaxID=588602 RepID=A0A1I3JMZ1_9RHOB|nr:hypothetical protein [Celeribacter neptunius]SFI61368.1 hypothetical protein SAMN04487991_0399 [Celeribacter neptunius]